MPNKSGEIKVNRSSIYDDLRAINSMDLTRNEIKVLICYRLEMDEASRQVRGKSQDELHEKCGLSKQKFSEASGSLQRRGLIVVQRFRNAPQTITVLALEMHEQPTLSGISANQEVLNSGYPDIGETGTPRKGDSGTPRKGGYEIYTAPVSAPKSAPERAHADELARQAYLAGRALKDGKVAKSARAIHEAIGELDGSRGLDYRDGLLTVTGEALETLERQFPRVDIAAVANKAAPDLRKSRPTYADCMAVLRKWAQYEIDFRRNRGSKGGEVIPFAVSPDTVRYAKPDFSEDVGVARA
jgi:hypothetical protein